MLNEWTGEVVGRLHVLRIEQKDLAKHMGITREYLNMILNGKKNPPGAEYRVKKALDEMETERNATNKTESSAN